jgi:anti-anti-sigma regulatory factor
VVVDVSGLPDDAGSTGGGLAAVAALARLRLAARRTGHRVRLKGAGPALRNLLELSGLAGEFEWEPEEGEEAVRVEE